MKKCKNCHEMYDLPHPTKGIGEFKMFGDYCPKCGTFNSDINKDSMIASGTCPVDDFTANWIVTSTEEDAVFENDCSDPSQNGLDVLGTFSYTHSPVNASLPSRYDICGADLGAGWR